MGTQNSSGVSVVGLQDLLVGSGTYDYYEVYIGFASTLPRRSYVGRVLFCNLYQFDGNNIFVELRSQAYFSQILGFIPTPQERALQNIGLQCVWQVPGIEWNVFATDFPYP